MIGQAIRAALTAVSKDSTLPLLECVYVAPGEVMATDRYRLVRSKYSMDAMADDKQDFEPFLIPSKQARKLIDLGTLYNIEKDEDGWITITTMDAKHEMVKKIIEPREGEYPPVGKLMDGWKSAKDANESGPESVAFDPEYLSAWPRRHINRPQVDKSREVMRIRFSEGSSGGGSKGVKFEYGDHFEAILMPVTFNDGR